MEFTKLDREDQEFLKILLSHEMSAEPGLKQEPGGERMDRVGPSEYSPLPPSVSGTPGGHLGSRLFDDSSTPRDGVAGASPYQTTGLVSFRDVEQTRSWSSTPGPVNSHSQRSDDQRCKEIGGMRPGKPVVGYDHRYSCPPSMTAPLPPKLGAFSGDGQKNEPTYAQWRSEVQSILRAIPGAHDHDQCPEGSEG